MALSHFDYERKSPWWAGTVVGHQVVFALVAEPYGKKVSQGVLEGLGEERDLRSTRQAWPLDLGAVVEEMKKEYALEHPPFFRSFVGRRQGVFGQGPLSSRDLSQERQAHAGPKVGYAVQRDGLVPGPHHRLVEAHRRRERSQALAGGSIVLAGDVRDADV